MDEKNFYYFKLLYGKELGKWNLRVDSNNFPFFSGFVFDNLTKILTRVSLDKVLDYLEKEKLDKGYRLGAILFDIDHFKNINDTYGHLAGDEILIAFARKVELFFDKLLKDFPYFWLRWGGEEFLLLIPLFSLEELKAITKKVVKYIEEETFTYKKQLIPVTVSAGYHLFKSSKDFKKNFEKLDLALYTAKGNGRNRAEEYYQYDWKGKVAEIFENKYLLVKGKYDFCPSPYTLFRIVDCRFLKYKFNYPEKGRAFFANFLDKDHFLIELEFRDLNWEFKKGDLVLLVKPLSVKEFNFWTSWEKKLDKEIYFCLLPSGRFFLKTEGVQANNKKWFRIPEFSKKKAVLLAIIVYFYRDLTFNFDFNLESKVTEKMIRFLLKKRFFELAEELLETWKDELDYNYYRGMIFFAKGELIEAQNYFSKVNEWCEEKLYNYVLSFFSTNSLNKVEELLEFWGENFSKDKNFYFFYFYLSFLNKKEDKMLKWEQKIGDVYLRTVAWYNIAEFYKEKKDWIQYHEWLEKVDKVAPVLKMVDNNEEFF